MPKANFLLKQLYSFAKGILQHGANSAVYVNSSWQGGAGPPDACVACGRTACGGEVPVRLSQSVPYMSTVLRQWDRQGQPALTDNNRKDKRPAPLPPMIINAFCNRSASASPSACSPAGRGSCSEWRQCHPLEPRRLCRCPATRPPDSPALWPVSMPSRRFASAALAVTKRPDQLPRPLGPTASVTQGPLRSCLSWALLAAIKASWAGTSTPP